LRHSDDMFVFFYCITNWTKHLLLQNSCTLPTF